MKALVDKCTHCKKGLMYADIFWDLKTSGKGFLQYVCANCGDVVDDVILRNRKIPMSE